MADTRAQDLLSEESQQSEDTEIILGTGKLLGIFFGLVILCAIFFSMGYMLGRGSSSSKTESAVTVQSGGSNNVKPTAGNKTALTAPAQPPSTASQQPPISPATEANSASVPATSNAAAFAPGDKPASMGGTYMVQVAAVSKREDADILVSALQKKQYPVFVAGAPGDSLFHVQVGPFTDPKDAEAMRSRLSADGYNAIVKK